MAAPKQYDVVRVRNVQGMHRDDVSRISKRSPEVGDTGAVVEILRERGSPDWYMVEAVERDGSTLWLAEFPAEALEVLVPHEKG